MRTLGLLAASCLPSAVAAAGVSVTVPVENRIAWSAGSGSFGRAVSGRYVAGLPLGVVQMRGSNALLLHAPGATSTNEVALSSVNDVATLYGTGATDGLAVVANSEPLRVGAFDPTTGAWNFEAVSISAWNGAKLVRSTDLDLSGTCDLVGVGSNSRTILFATSSSGSFSAQTGFSINYDVLDIQPIDWTGSNAPEIAINSTWGVEVYDQSGTRLYWRSSLQAGTCMAVLPQDPTATGDKDTLAIVGKGASGPNQYLLVATAGGTQTAVSLGDAKIATAASGDRDDDGDADLWLTTRAAQILRQFRNDGGSQFFSTSTELTALSVGDPTQTAPNTHAIPIIADLDGDADHAWDGPLDRENDLYFASEDAGFGVCYPAIPAYVPAGPPASGFDYDSSEHAIFDGVDLCRHATEPTVAVKLALKNGWDADTSDATHLEVLVWKDAPTLPPLDEIDGTTVCHEWFADSSSVNFFANANNTGRIHFDVAVSSASLPPYCFHEKFFMAIRPIKVDTNGNVAQTWRYAHGSFTGDFSPDPNNQFPHFGALTGLTGAWQGALPTTQCQGDDAGTPGGFVPRTQLPPIPAPVVIITKSTPSPPIQSSS
ncbi:MAG: hypothetical protein EPO68_11770 [Planctomycetota bacterium]|nr:MAG: hypothetical protein EPO68_11770 [Planctomycetota bacterium]